MPSDTEQYIPENPGFVPDEPDDRDFRFDDFVAGAPITTPEVDWDKGYDLERAVGLKLRREAQDGSLSCVSQATSTYAEILHYLDVGERVQLSPRDLYSRVHLPNGGSYLRDNVKTVVKRGIAPESVVPSYENGNAPSEAFMRKKPEKVEADQLALKYQGKDYYSVPATIDSFARAIRSGDGLLIGMYGSNPGWRQPNGEVRPPEYSERIWGHAVLGIGYGKRKGRKYIKFLNSWSRHWGDDGCGYVFEDYFNAQRVFPGWTLVDKPNAPQHDPMRYVIDENRDQWLIAEKPVKLAISIPDEKALEELQQRGLVGAPEAISSLDGYLTYRGASESSWRAFLNL